MHDLEITSYHRNMKKHCLFCNKTPLTKEHVLPKWLRKHYPIETVINEFTGSKKKWITQPFDLKAIIVCKDCNEGWMSYLEDQFRPIFNRMVALKKLELSESDQAVISFWAQKTVLMLNQATPGSVRITSETFREIYNSKTATKRIMVKLGWRMKYGQNVRDPLASFSIKQIPSMQIEKNILEEVKKQVNDGGFAWKATLAIGPLVFELMGHNMNVVVEISGNTQVMQIIRPYKNNLIWPIEWPIESEGGLHVIHER
jgi:hypothetical protein